MLYESMDRPPKRGEYCRVTYSEHMNKPEPTKTFEGYFVKLHVGGGGRWEQEYLVDGNSVKLMDDREVFDVEILERS